MGDDKRSSATWTRILELTGYKFKGKTVIDAQNAEGKMDPDYMKEQLTQCWEDWRHYNSTIWHLPSSTTAIVGGLIGVAFYAVSEPLPRAILIGLAALFSFSMVVALIKHRYFQDVRTAVIEYMNERLGIKGFSPIRGDLRLPRKLPRAYAYLLFSMQALFVVTSSLAIGYFIVALSGW